MSSRVTLWIIIAITLFAILIDIPNIPNLPSNFNFPLKLGLDLQGGTQLILQTQMDKIDPLQKDQALESAKNIIERRVNLYGISEAIVQSSKVGEET